MKTDLFRSARFWIAVWAIGLLAWYLFLGERFHLPIHDNLDSEVLYRILLAKNGEATYWPQVMNGLPRQAVNVSDWNLTSLFFKVLPPIWAYLLHAWLVQMVAAYSTYFLTKRIWQTAHFAQTACLAIAFGSLPFYSIYGLSVAGLPCLLTAWLLLRSKASKAPRLVWLPFLIFPFWSQFVLSGFAVLAVLGLWFFIDFFRSKTLNHNQVLALGCLVLGTAWAEKDLFTLFLGGSRFVSHRMDWVLSFNHQSLAQSLKEAFLMFIQGEYHAASLHGVVFLALGVWFFRTKVWTHLIWGVLAGLMGLSLFFGLWFWEAWIPVKTQVGVLKSFNAARLHFLMPVLWLTLFILILKDLDQSSIGLKSLRTQLIQGLLGFHLLFVWGQNPSIVANLAETLGRSRLHAETMPSWAGFFSPKAFRQIQAQLPSPPDAFRVVALGLHPAILQYNGFYTLDGYQNNYPLPYKNSFRQLMATELSRSQRWQSYFEAWGNRCYVLPEATASLKSPFYITQKSPLSTIPRLEFDTNLFKKMGGRFIFAAVEVQNAARLGWKLHYKTVSDLGDYQIWVYEAL